MFGPSLLVAAALVGATATASATDLVVEPLLTLSTAEDKPLKGNVKTSGRGGVTYKAGQPPAHGSLDVDAATGAFTYQPTADFFGGDGFTILVGEAADAREVVVRVEVTPVNDPPVVKTGRLVTSEDVMGSAAVPARDVDGDALTFRIQRAPAHGKGEVDAKTGVVRLTPSADFFGSDTVTVEVSDGKLSATAELSIDVRPINDPPSVEQLLVKTDEDRPVESGIKSRDPEGDAVTFRIVTPPKSGSLMNFDEKTGRFSYAPTKDMNGGDSFVVSASDGALQSENVTVRVEVAPVNDAPQAQGTALNTDEDKAGTATVSAKDIDGDDVTFRVAKGPAHGTVSVDAKKGTVQLTPAPDWYGKDVAIIEASDGKASATAEVAIDVRPVNDAPTLVVAALATDEDKTVDGRLSGKDVEGDALRFRLVRGPKLGSIARVDETTGAFSYVPSPDAFGEDSAVFEVVDASARGEGTVKISVRPVNDAPVARPASLTTNEDVPASGRVDASDVDKDTLRYRLGRAPALGEVSVDEKTGSFRYAPSADKNGPDSFIVEVSDGTASANSEVKVTLAPVNDPPKVRDEAMELNEDTPGTATIPASDPDGDPISFRLLPSAETRLGKLELMDAAAGTVRFTPTPDANGEVTLPFEAAAGRDKVQGSVKVRVLPVNDAPIVKPLARETQEDTPLEIAVEANDVDGDALTLVMSTPPKHGEAKFVSDGKIAFVPNKDFHGEVKFAVVANDGKAKSSAADIAVKVLPVNDMPLAQSGTWSPKEDTSFSEKVRATDIDGDALSYAVARPPARGKITLDAKTGAFTYEPSANLFGEDRFAFTASDGTLTSAPAEVVLRVAPVDDPPRAIAGHFVVGMRARYEGRLEGYDPEGAKVKFRINSQPVGGKVTLEDPATGRFTFTSDGTGKGLTSFKFSVSDGKLWSEVAVMDVTFR